MKSIKCSLLALLLLAVVSDAYCQLALTGFYGYTVQDRVHGYSGDVTISDGAHYGGMLSFQKSNQLSFGFTYQYQSTTFKVSSYSLPGNSGNVKGSVSYYMLGASHSPDFSGKVAPFGGGMLGMAVFAPNEKYSSETKFAVGGKLGVIVHASDRVGIVLQAQLMIPVQGVGVGVGCGSGGCGSGVTTSSSATQLGFTGGIEIKLGD